MSNVELFGMDRMAKYWVSTSLPLNKVQINELKCIYVKCLVLKSVVNHLAFLLL